MPRPRGSNLKLRHGRVTVSGPVSGGDIVLRAGQRLQVDLSKDETFITEHKPEEAWLAGTAGPAVPAVETPTDRPPAVPQGPAVQGGAAPSRPTAVAAIEGDHRWAETLAAGHLDRILAEVKKAGVKATLERATSDDLFALADAARYRRHVELARDALLAERRRFPNSPRTLDVAFLLGRVEEMRERGMAQAVEWYDDYLTRTPSGTYASEALGRKMTLTNKLEGAARARLISARVSPTFPDWHLCRASAGPSAWSLIGHRLCLEACRPRICLAARGSALPRG